MSQPALFIESFTDALRDAVRAAGGTKVVACRLWPEKAPDQAARILSNCLNEHRDERLTPDQVLLVARLAREHGCHSIMAFMAGELGYAPPIAIEPEDEVVRLQREYVDATKSLLKMAERIERLRSVA